MKTFDQIKPSGPLLLHPGETSTPVEENTARYVSDRYDDTEGWLYDQIADTKQDLSEVFPPDCLPRLQALLEVYRVAWEALRAAKGVSDGQ